MFPSSILFYLTALTAATFATQDDDNMVTWTKPGIRYRARSATMHPRFVTVTETQTMIPTTTLQLRSLVAPVQRSVKRAFLNGWSYQDCIADDEHLPVLVSPFPYQLSSEEVSGASCMDFCDGRGDSLAATQNGNECWCGEASKATSVTTIKRSKCNIPCAAAPGEMCGGENSLSIFTRAGG